jgi:hypothetical protein
MNLRDNGEEGDCESQTSDLRTKRSAILNHFISGNVISEGCANAVGSALAVQFAICEEGGGDAGTALSLVAGGVASGVLGMDAHAGCGRAAP